jgi:uncharacterized protein YcbX
MLTVSDLYIYPVKSLGGFSLPAAMLTDRGFKYDRRWMLIDENNRFISQREVPAMAFLQTDIQEENLLITNKQTADLIMIPFAPLSAATMMVTVWDDTCVAQHVSDEADAWFSRQLNMSCRLVYMPDSTKRTVDQEYAHNREITSFSDGYPLLIIGQSSLDDLNSRLATHLPMNRFRPNIVFTGGLPFQEDNMKQFSIGDIQFFGVKRCARCVITTIDQESGVKAKEPLKTLSTYRAENQKIYFGQNLLFNGSGTIRIGDRIALP